jgi:hypothetical protein
MTIEQLTLELVNVDVLYGRFYMFQSFGLQSYQWDEYRNICDGSIAMICEHFSIIENCNQFHLINMGNMCWMRCNITIY